MIYYPHMHTCSCCSLRSYRLPNNWCISYFHPTYKLLLQAQVLARKHYLFLLVVRQYRLYPNWHPDGQDTKCLAAEKCIWNPLEKPHVPTCKIFLSWHNWTFGFMPMWSYCQEPRVMHYILWVDLLQMNWRFLPWDVKIKILYMHWFV